MKRNFGLDLVRASAILFVLADHAWYFRTNALSTPNVLSVLGFIGVELFFVLSGFLIGQILVRDFDSTLSFQTIRTFYKRRWLRTLPLYYLLLVIMIVGTAILTHRVNLHLTHFVFLQNFFPQEIDFFGVAWSLAVEEWFYLLLPLFFTPIALNIKSQKYKVLCVFITIMLLMLLRVGFVFDTNEAFETIRRNIAFRFDALLIGVLLAMIKSYYRRMYERLSTLPIFFFSLFGILLMGATYTWSYMGHSIDYSLFLRTIGFSILSFSIAGIIPYIESSEFINNKIVRLSTISGTITSISAISYSLYLIHAEVFLLLSQFLSTRISPVPLLLSAVFISFTCAYIMYHLFEKPMMALRDKKFPSFPIHPFSSLSILSKLHH